MRTRHSLIFDSFVLNLEFMPNYFDKLLI